MSNCVKILFWVQLTFSLAVRDLSVAPPIHPIVLFLFSIMALALGQSQLRIHRCDPPKREGEWGVKAGLAGTLFTLFHVPWTIAQASVCSLVVWGKGLWCFPGDKPRDVGNEWWRGKRCWRAKPKVHGMKAYLGNWGLFLGQGLASGFANAGQPQNCLKLLFRPCKPTLAPHPQPQQQAHWRMVPPRATARWAMYSYHPHQAFE